jgi:DNA-binding NarL/FixJ family response regulator
MKPIQLLIADDHELFRDGLKTLILSASDVELVAEAASGTEAIQLAADHRPDVVLLDIQMPEMNGIEAARQIVAAIPEAKVLMLTMFDDDHSVFAAMRAGARGYVLKGVKREEMLRAIRAVAGGEAIFSPAIATRMVDFFGQIRPSPPATLFPELTEREREVLALLARDYKNADIARELVISPKTVRNHVSHILSKLQAADRVEAARQAREAGYGHYKPNRKAP